VGNSTDRWTCLEDFSTFTRLRICAHLPDPPQFRLPCDFPLSTFRIPLPEFPIFQTAANATKSDCSIKRLAHTHTQTQKSFGQWKTDMNMNRFSGCVTGFTWNAIIFLDFPLD